MCVGTGIANFMKRMQGATASEEASGMPEPQDSEVIVLTPDNFTKTLRVRHRNM
jgi:hypothetical protein